jgi:hypothetical protein
MTLFLHKFQGKCAAGDQFTYSWWANSTRSLAAAQTAAWDWNAALWLGAVAGNGLRDHLPVDVAMQNVTTVIIEQATGKQLARADTAQLVGGVVLDNALPADVALCVSLRSNLPQRAGRGRFYLPQPAATQTTSEGRVAPDFVADVVASLTAAWAAYNTASDRPVIYGRTSRLLQGIVNFNVGDLFDTQRRRENKVSEARTVAAMP